MWFGWYLKYVSSCFIKSTLDFCEIIQYYCGLRQRALVLNSLSFRPDKIPNPFSMSKAFWTEITLLLMRERGVVCKITNFELFVKGKSAANRQTDSPRQLKLPSSETVIYNGTLCITVESFYPAQKHQSWNWQDLLNHWALDCVESQASGECLVFCSVPSVLKGHIVDVRADQ